MAATDGFAVLRQIDLLSILPALERCSIPVLAFPNAWRQHRRPVGGNDRIDTGVSARRRKLDSAGLSRSGRPARAGDRCFPVLGEATGAPRRLNPIMLETLQRLLQSVRIRRPQRPRRSVFAGRYRNDWEMEASTTSLRRIRLSLAGPMHQCHKNRPGRVRQLSVDFHLPIRTATLLTA